MTVLRMIAVAFIFCVSSVAWMILGGSVWQRTDTADYELREDVGTIYGQPQQQQAPTFTYTAKGKKAASLDVTGTEITATFDLDQRQKGLMWYSTYQVDFAGAYRVTNPTGGDVDVQMRFAFPNPNGVYDGFAVTADGADVPVTYDAGVALASFPLGPGKTAAVDTGYKTGGLDRWSYMPSVAGVAVVKDFALTMDTDFKDVDFPEGSVSPTEEKIATENGWTLTWAYDSVVSGREIALEMPQRTQPGPLAARIAFFAPVALLFYFAALVLLTATKDVSLHPMHYAFLAAAFFAFHLLFAYLVDRIDINLAFAICSVVSVALCLGYLRVVVGANRALAEIGLSQSVFLVLFSYSFFFEGLTGLAVAIGSVVTLAYFMAKTAKVDWEKVFERKPKPVPAWMTEPPTPGPRS